jgi:glyoxylase-like metal-dependent hydrolase (beta-lactamase superfamily II)
VMNADGTGQRNLSNHPSDDIHPYWSPDGERILFNSNRTRNQAGTPVTTIFSMRADGSDVRRVSREVIEETYAQYSPDGTRIAFRRRLEEETPGWERNPGNSDIYIMNADGTASRRLTAHPGFEGWPSWTPDGQWIVFAGEGSAEYQVEAIRPDGSARRRLTDGPGSFTKPIVSPDGKRIICTRTLDGNVELFVIELDTVLTPSVVLTARQLLTASADAMGGVATISALPGLSTGYHLIERSLGQEEWASGPAAASVQIGEREYQPRLARERLTMKRHMSGGRLYERVLNAGRPRWLDSVPAPARNAESSLSAALAALHPEALLPRILAQSAELSTRDRPRTVAGKRVVPIRTRIGSLPITVFVDERDSVLIAVDWTEPAIAPDGSSLRTVFSQYRPAYGVPGNPRLPHLVEVWQGVQLLHARSYAEYRVGGTLADSTAVISVSAQSDVNAVEVSPGVFHLRGSDYASLMVDVGDRVFVIELPESVARARAVLSTARQRAGARPLSVVVTHLHDDHIAGISAAEGIEIIAHERIAESVRSILLRARPASAPVIRAVGDRTPLGSSGELELLAPKHSHAEGMLVAYLPATQTLFEVDLLRGLLPHSTTEFVEWVRSKNLSPRSVLSSHGTELPWERVVATAAAWRASLEARR